MLFFILLFTTLRFYGLNQDINAAFHRYFESDPWNQVPRLELALRMNSDPVFVRLYTGWFLRSLKLFWPDSRLKLTLVLDAERQEDRNLGERLSKIWPRPKIAYLQPGNTSVYQGNQRRRMFLSYFYPEQYVTAEYVGFIDADTMFTTVVTPELLFADSRPTVQARIGEPFWQQHWECWSDVTEYFLGEKEALQCMSYFPVVMKVEHIIELRGFVEMRFGKPFTEVFRDSFAFENPHFKGSTLNDCLCQFSVICNYVWYKHRDEYDFHLQMTPDDTWDGGRRRPSQQTTDHIRAIAPRYRQPKPRFALHSRHYVENGVYVSGAIDTTKEPYYSQLTRKVEEGLCFAIGFDRCPRQCYSFDRNSLQITAFSFEIFDWIWDPRCMDEQEKHYKNVKRLTEYNERHGKRMFGLDSLKNICEDIFSTDV